MAVSLTGKLGVAAALTAATFTTNAFAEADAKADRAFVETVVKEYLEKHPEKVFEALVAYQEKQEAEKQKDAQEKVKQYEDKLNDLAMTPAIGNVKDADVTVVEFFDYACGYCRRSYPIMQQLVEDDPKVRVLFKEFPILGKASDIASKAAVAVFVTDPEKYIDAHQLLMTQRLRDKESILKAFAGAGINAEEAEKAMDGEEVAEILESAASLARNIGVNGTPAFVINGKFIGGALNLERFKSLVAEAREEKK